MLIRAVWLFGVLLASTVSAQTIGVTIPTDAEWVGPLEFDNGTEVLIAPTITRLTITGESVQGTFNVLKPGTMSGTLEGTISDKAEMRVTVRLFGNGTVPDLAGRSITEIERCHGEGVMTGKLTKTGVWRLTARELRSETAANAVRGRNCRNPTRVVWTLQRRD